MLCESVRDNLDGKNLFESIYARFPLSSINRVEIRPNIIFKLCEEKSVIHLGCTDHLPLIDTRIDSGTYMHRQLSYVASKCIGIDINEEAVSYVRQKGIDNIILADITKPGISELENNRWDYLVIPDVLEHIGNPVSFLQQIGENYSKNIGGIIITVPNALSYTSVINSIHTGTEMVNYDHCFWFTPYTLCKVVHTAGLIIDDLQMCSYENPTESILQFIEIYKQRPILLNTIGLIAHFNH